LFAKSLVAGFSTSAMRWAQTASESGKSPIGR
jgi:hypothetical protein